MAKKLQKPCGAGATMRDGCIEIQVNKREEMTRILIQTGFRRHLSAAQPEELVRTIDAAALIIGTDNGASFSGIDTPAQRGFWYSS